MMRAAILLSSMLLSCACFGAALAAPKPLPDTELARVGGADGVSFAMRLELNREGDHMAPGDSRLWIGQQVDGRMTYTVLKNVTGVVQMVGLGIDARTAPDGTAYVALTLPVLTRFTDAGFESLSVQADPHAPVTQSLGRFTLNGELQMQGQLRLWAH
jgi:hypothetical protein